MFVIAGKITLGRSFGIVPANRGVVIGGPYTLVRHPIYTGYLLTHVAFACAYPTPWNLAILAATDVALVVRALDEERVLAADRTYQAYCSRVAWHLVPGSFDHLYRGGRGRKKPPTGERATAGPRCPLRLP